jgi:ankyrin repeat protein
MSLNTNFNFYIGGISPHNINAYYKECHDQAFGADVAATTCPNEQTCKEYKETQINFAVAIFLKKYFENNENAPTLAIQKAKEYFIKDICDKLEVETIEQGIYKCAKTFKETSKPISTYTEFDLLCRHAKEINQQDSDGNTPLNLSQQAKVEYGEWLTPLLLDNGADCNIANKEKETPLHYATLRRDYQDAERLMKYGADDSVKDQYGRTPGDWAMINNFNYWGPHLAFLKSRNYTPPIKIRESYF